MSFARPFLFKHRPPSWRLIACLAVVAMLCRAAIPAGYMPDAGKHEGRLALTLCSAGGLVPAMVGDIGAAGFHAPPHDAVSGGDCPYGLLAGQAMLPVVLADAATLPAPALLAFWPPAFRALFPQPPAGPPLGPRAPPYDLA